MVWVYGIVLKPMTRDDDSDDDEFGDRDQGSCASLLTVPASYLYVPDCTLPQTSMHLSLSSLRPCKSSAFWAGFKVQLVMYKANIVVMVCVSTWPVQFFSPTCIPSAAPDSRRLLSSSFTLMTYHASALRPASAACSVLHTMAALMHAVNVCGMIQSCLHLQQQIWCSLHLTILLISRLHSSLLHKAAFTTQSHQQHFRSNSHLQTVTLLHDQKKGLNVC